MGLRIIRNSDPIVIDQLIFTIHSPPGIGKTSLGFTADSPILLDFDSGAYRAENRGDSVPVRSWHEVESIDPADLAGFKTIVIDTAGRALDMLTQKVIADDPRMGKGGQLSIQGFGKLKTSFTNWLSYIKSLRMDIVLLAHTEEKMRGEDVVDRLDVQGGSKNEIYKCSDVMARLSMKDGKRILNCNPSEFSYGKNPVGLDVMTVPNFADNAHFLGDVIRDVKKRINEQTEEQAQAAKFLADWKARCDAAITAKEFDAIRDDLLKETRSNYVKGVMSGALKDSSQAQGFAFDGAKKKFVSSPNPLTQTA